MIYRTPSKVIRYIALEELICYCFCFSIVYNNFFDCYLLDVLPKIWIQYVEKDLVKSWEPVMMNLSTQALRYLACLNQRVNYILLFETNHLEYDDEAEDDDDDEPILLEHKLLNLESESRSFPSLDDVFKFVQEYVGGTFEYTLSRSKSLYEMSTECVVALIRYIHSAFTEEDKLEFNIDQTLPLIPQENPSKVKKMAKLEKSRIVALIMELFLKTRSSDPKTTLQELYFSHLLHRRCNISGFSFLLKLSY